MSIADFEQVMIYLVVTDYTLAFGQYGTKYSRMDQVKFFKCCLPLILLGPFLNNLSHI